MRQGSSEGRAKASLQGAPGKPGYVPPVTGTPRSPLAYTQEPSIISLPLWSPRQPFPDRITHLCLSLPQPDITEKYLSASECGSPVDGHPEVPETKDGTNTLALGLGQGEGWYPSL